MDLFEYSKKNDGVENRENIPLAERMRPEKLEEFVGQSHIIGENKLLYRAIKADKLNSIILHGVPGTGKTTLARIISNETKYNFRKLNAVTSGVKDIRAVVEEAYDEKKGIIKEKTILFVDEIHRFNKSQQDALLPYVENGSIILIGATTENPYFEVNKALISRAMVFKLEPLSNENLKTIINRALKDDKKGYGFLNIDIDDDARKHLIEVANGDARIALNAIELGVLTSKADETGKLKLTIDIIQECIQQKPIRYEKSGDEHYDNISAFIKSVRGSDPSASLYWLGKMIFAGEDPKFIARRLVILASEDIGNANPHALTMAVSTFNAINLIGMPEGRIILAQATTYLACSEKSNAVYIGIDEVLADIRKGKIYDVPNNIKDKPENYLYPHNYETGYVKQVYMPKELEGTEYYRPKDIGEEKKTREKLMERRNKK